MKLRCILLILLFCSSASVVSGATLPEESLTYRVMYKWGLINKKAGTATVSLRHGPARYETLLTAKSEPWADRLYKVRDTLRGAMDYGSMRPVFYEKIANEGSERKHDLVTYDYSTPGRVGADCTRKVYKKEKLKIDQRQHLDAAGAATDMLSSFYFMRTLPFDTMAKGETRKIDIFSGKRKELLTIKYHGIVDADLDGKWQPAHYITFTFTSKGGKKTSDDMQAWIATDAARTPLRLEGKLAVGNVHCILER